MKKAATILSIALLGGCGPRVPVLNLDQVPLELRAEASNVSVYQLGSGRDYPVIEESLGPVEAYSCKHLMTDPPASKGEALQRLRVKAAEKEANAVIDVTFDERGTDAWGTNCWESIYASGMAVKAK